MLPPLEEPSSDRFPMGAVSQPLSHRSFLSYFPALFLAILPSLIPWSPFLRFAALLLNALLVYAPVCPVFDMVRLVYVQLEYLTSSLTMQIFGRMSWPE